MNKGIVVLGLLALTGPAYAGQCRDNYTKSGNFLQGRTFNTFYDSSESVAAAYKRVYLGATQRGLKIVNADKEMGIISAERSTVRTSDNTPIAVTYNYSIEPKDKGSRVSITMKSPGDVQVREEPLIAVLCDGAPE